VSQPTLLVSAGIALLGAVAYAYVAARLLRRKGLGRGDALAMRCFAVWWSALAFNLGLVAPIYWAGGVDALTLPWQVASSILQRVLLAVSLVGLMAYLLYLLTGRTRIPVLAAIYAGYVALLMGSMAYQQPNGLLVLRWRTDLTYARAGPLGSELLSLFLIILPPVAASIAYLRLFFRVADRTQRYRIAVVSAALLVWWVVAVLAGQRGLLDNGPLQITGRALGAASALAVLSAFAPPAWVQRRFGVEPYPNAG
jgi:hypothetical protein